MLISWPLDTFNYSPLGTRVWPWSVLIEYVRIYNCECVKNISCCMWQNSLFCMYENSYSFMGQNILSDMCQNICLLCMCQNILSGMCLNIFIMCVSQNSSCMCQSIFSLYVLYTCYYIEFCFENYLMSTKCLLLS